MTDPGLEVERVVGRTAYVKGHLFPFVGIATAEEVECVAKIKKLLLAQFWGFRSISKRIDTFERQAWAILEPHLLHTDELTPIARELESIVGGWLGIILGHIIEFDYAYRCRLQDMFTETSMHGWSRRPIRELWRAMAVNKRRDWPGIHRKLRRYAIFVTILLCKKTYRNKFKNAFKTCNYDNLRLTPADVYWLQRRTDYHYDERPH